MVLTRHTPDHLYFLNFPNIEVIEWFGEKHNFWSDWLVGLNDLAQESRSKYLSEGPWNRSSLQLGSLWPLCLVLSVTHFGNDYKGPKIKLCQATKWSRGAWTERNKKV
jgi:hypothetical protein